jgi:N-acylneuraminate cytidylyltransferase
VIKGKSVLAIITARGGSKGVPRKNVRTVGGKPLIAHTIDAAKTSAYVDRLVLSTDDAEIASVAARFGCEVPFMRPPTLATDTASSEAVIIDALARCPGYDFFVLLQPTSPLRTAADIDACAEACIATNAPVCVSVTEVRESPFLMYRLKADRTLSPILPPVSATRRQDLEAVYAINGAVYFAHCDWYMEHKTLTGPSTIAHVMPAERSVDLDTEADFAYLAFQIGD